MKGKVTKDILLRVGQGVMRIPRSRPNDELTNDSRGNKTAERPATPHHREKPVSSN